MKRFFITAIALAFGAIYSQAQTVNFRDTEPLYDRGPFRTNIVVPGIDGLNCYKADLHVHTMFSDGEISPAERVKEAWIDGLDILAITDHLETRRQERAMLKFLKGYSPDKKGFEAINTRCSRGVPADERGIVSDLNFSVELARKAAVSYPDITIIKGAEISREPVKIGHYCALFTKDNNTIYSTDDAQTIRNARAQGALITHNHPGWERKSTDYTEFEKKVYAEGLIDGVEVTNGRSFYPKMVRRALEQKLYMVSATDIHATTASIFGKQNFYRDMTLIFAKDTSEKSLRKALLDRKTLGYCGGNIIGEISLLKKFFDASISIKFVKDAKNGNMSIMLTNHTSFDFDLKYKGRLIRVPALGNTITSMKKQSTLILTVDNMYHIDYQHPTFEVKVLGL